MGRIIKTRLIFSTEYLTRLINALLLAILLYAPSVSAQDECFSLTECSLSGEPEIAELVPLTELAKCEDYKAKSKAVPGLIMAERKALVASSKCASALDIFAGQLTLANIGWGREKEKRIDAENRVLFVGVIVALISVAATIGAFFLASAFSET